MIKKDFSFVGLYFLPAKKTQVGTVLLETILTNSSTEYYWSNQQTM